MADNRKISLSNSTDKTHYTETKNNNNRYMLNPELTSQKRHLAIEYSHKLQLLNPSTKLINFLASFDKPRSIDPETFAEGVKLFIKLANSNPLRSSHSQSGDDRNALYGNIYLGLHYNNDLVKLWNSSHHNSDPIKATDVSTLAPLGWDSIFQDEFFTLIYKGQQPAQALDQLVKGPTVIDCGMFTQLSFWFGIRYMLGNTRFNQCFGRAPFFITQNVYNKIEHNDKPYSGNPLYSFLSTKEQAIIPSVNIKHITNTSLYALKHPGGNYGGENCILIGKQHYIFDPHLEVIQELTESAVLNLLRNAFNAERAQYDTDRLSLYASNPEKFHPKLLQTYGQLIKTAEILRNTTLTEEEFLEVKQNPSLELTFDFHKFSNWLWAVENHVKVAQTDYLPCAIDHSQISIELLNVIPFENKTSMTFSTFKQETSQQNELMAMSKQFCLSVMAGASKLIILSGKAGVGKTASAVCAAKELAARGKKIAWISEVMVNGWTDQAKSIEDLNNCSLEIDKLLATKPDVVFLDDDNLAGFSGNLLLEKIYSWYVKNTGKGLFITSNEPISFKNCYGYKLDRRYYYPPFSDYHSYQYLNWQFKTDLAGESLRSKRDGQSIGAIVSDSSWKINESKLESVELIPAFDENEELVPIRQSLRKTGSMGSAYDTLSPIQQRWINIQKAGGVSSLMENGQPLYMESYLTVNPSNFEKTSCKTIALEMREYHSRFFGKKIDEDSVHQLIRVLNYAHDQGGRQIILINQTSYSHEQLLIQIKAQLPSSERERTWSRLMPILCETEDSIFKYEQFNGKIENIPENKIVDNDKSSKEFGIQPILSTLHEIQLSLFKNVKTFSNLKSDAMNTALSKERKEKYCSIPKRIFASKTSQ